VFLEQETFMPNLTTSFRATLVIALALPVFARADVAPYGWNMLDDGMIVQYGVPDSDDRAIRLDCTARGRIGIMGPSATELAEGAAISVTFKGRAGSKLHRGEVVMMGDGANFSVVVAASDDAVTTLLAGKDLVLAQGRDTWTIPGKGAARVLKPMLARCARS
jgi:hypothetical protein